VNIAACLKSAALDRRAGRHAIAITASEARSSAARLRRLKAWSTGRDLGVIPRT
jgi:hypothetical protein